MDQAPLKTIMISAYLTPAQKKALDKLYEKTRIPRAVLIREALDDLVVKYKNKGGGR